MSDNMMENRDKLIEMTAQWYVEAGNYNVLPIDGSSSARLKRHLRCPRS